MKKRQKKRKGKSSIKKNSRKLKKCVALMIVPEKELRKRALKQYRYFLKQVNDYQEKWDAYHNVYQNEYHQWLHSNFGVKLTELRELTYSFNDKRGFFMEVEDTVFFDGLDYYSAYQKVKLRRDNPDEFNRMYAESENVDDEDFDDEEDLDDEDDYDDEDDDFDSMMDDMFNDLIFPGMDELFEKCFKNCSTKKEAKLNFENIIGEFVPDDFITFLWNKYNSKSKNKGVKHNRLVDQNATSLYDDKEIAIKKLYRNLAKRIHPDTRSSDSPLAEVWHDIQEAYQNNDLEHLKFLETQLDSPDGRISKSSTPSVIFDAVRFLKEKAVKLREKLYSIKKQPAMIFSNPKKRDKLFNITDAEMDDEIDYLKSSLRAIEKDLEKWSRPPVRKQKKSVVTKQKIVKKETFDSNQFEFSFS